VLKEHEVAHNADITWIPGWWHRETFFASPTDLPLSFFLNYFRG